jgi:hypothetical protein
VFQSLSLSQRIFSRQMALVFSLLLSPSLSLLLFLLLSLSPYCFSCNHLTSILSLTIFLLLSLSLFSLLSVPLLLHVYGAYGRSLAIENDYLNTTLLRRGW